MPDIDLASVGAALVILGIVWAIGLYVVIGMTGVLFGAAVASLGLLVIAAIPSDDDSPPTADDLADE